MSEQPERPEDADSVRSDSGATKAAVAFIFVTVILDVVALGIVIPVLPRLVEEFVGGDSAGAARIFGVFGAVWALMHFVFSPILGSLSDRFGRRPIVLLSNFGLGLDYVLMALAPTLGWLFVGRVISGITAASFGTATAYIADVTPPARRAASFGIIGMAFGLGFILGPALGGFLGEYDPRLPFWAAAGLSIANGLYGIFVLPESLPRDRRAAFSWRKANPIGSIGLLARESHLARLAGIAFMNALAHVSLPATAVLYMAYRYEWGGRAVGGVLAIVGLCGAIVQGGIVRPAVARFGERRMLLSGLIAGSIGFLIYGLARTGAGFLAGIPIMALWGFASPSMQSLMTRCVGPSEQGRLQGAIASLVGLAELAGPIAFTQAYALGIAADHGALLPGAAFVLAALLLAIGAALALTLRTGATDEIRRC